MNNVLTEQERNARLVRYLGFKLKNRGCKENELLLAKLDLKNLSHDLLVLLGGFLDEDDRDIFAWLAGDKKLPGQYMALDKVFIKVF